jgi:hypothetical protein
MPRPDSVTEKDIAEWSDNIDNDEQIPKYLLKEPLIREVCFAGLWMCEELEKLGCPEYLIVRIQEAAGRLSFGRDPWEVSKTLLDTYKANELNFEQDPSGITN